MFDQYILEKKSIKQALSGDWKGAIITNLDILKELPDNLPALNRLAKAQIELGLIEEAKSNLQKVMSIDSYNSVAKLNLEKIELFSNSKINITPYRAHVSTNLNFIEEPGKTKIISLAKIGDSSVTSSLQVGEEVFMKLAKKIKIINCHKQFIGYLPDDLSITLFHLSKMGNKYIILVKSASKNNVEIFIREIKQAKRLKGMPSFTDYKSGFIPQISHRSLNETPLEIYDSMFPEESEDN